MKRLFALLLLCLSSSCVVVSEDMLHTLQIDQRDDCQAPIHGEYRVALADEHCRPFERIVVPSGWCVAVRGEVGDVVTKLEDIASCSDPKRRSCQMFAQPFPGDGVIDIYLREGSYRFAPLSKGCSCDGWE